MESNGPTRIQITPASVPAKAFVIIDVTMAEFNVFRKDFTLIISFS